MSNPTLFISYSWTSEDHEKWVIALATALRESGVDVLLDKWELREGNDAHHFMEQMVSNPAIKKVIMICDRLYAEKANDRAGGVGTETQIISAELYHKQDQDKFVAVLSERDSDGNAYLPIYYRSRIYIDLSTEELYARNFEQLLRWIFGKPLYVKPSLGKAPAFLSDDAKPSLGTTVVLQRALDGIRSNRPYRSGACSEYLARLVEGFRMLALTPGIPDFDDLVVKSIDDFTPYRSEAIEFFFALAVHGVTPDEERAVHRFFETTIPFMHRPENVSNWREWDYDNYRFIVQELFLYAIASLLRYERFESAAQLLRQPYYVRRPAGQGDGTVSFAALYQTTRSLDHRNNRLKLHRLSVRSDMLKQRAAGSGVDFVHLMQADFVLYIRDCLDSIRGNHRQRWHPDTLLFTGHEGSPFEIFARAKSRRYFETAKCLLDIHGKEELGQMLTAIRDKALAIPMWEFETFAPAALLGYDNLATQP